MASVDFIVRNGVVANTYFTVGNTTVNTTINSTSLAIGGTISANGSTNTGSAGYILFSGGSSSNAYWAPSSAVSINVNSTFAWTNTHSFSNTVTFNGVVSSQANTLNQTLTDGATINWDVSQGQIATVTLGGNRTIAAPTNLKVTTYILHVIQDSTGSRTLTWNSIFKWPAGIAPTLTTSINSRDIFSFVSDGTYLYGSFLPNVK